MKISDVNGYPDLVHLCTTKIVTNRICPLMSSMQMRVKMKKHWKFQILYDFEQEKRKSPVTKFSNTLALFDFPATRCCSQLAFKHPETLSTQKSLERLWFRRLGNNYGGFRMRPFSWCLEACNTESRVRQSMAAGPIEGVGVSRNNFALSVALKIPEFLTI